jgi:pimeloyl-ACP methyl ester carboxylesterase
MSKLPSEAIVGQAAGVPFVAVPPAGGARPSAPVVVGWHLLDPPRTEAAFAAAVPLEGLDAWRIYLGLPLSGSRMPPGGADELMRLGYEDAVLKLDVPIAYGAAEELGPALADLRARLGIDPGPIGAMGGSLGAAVAQLLMAEGEVEVSAAVLISPVVQERRKVEAIGKRFGFAYPWSEESSAAADRLDFVARASELAGPAVLLVVGEDDDPAFREGAADLAAALGNGERARVVTVAGMGHELATEPGIEPEPQTPHAAIVDRHAVEWFRRHLIASPA